MALHELEQSLEYKIAEKTNFMKLKDIDRATIIEPYHPDPTELGLEANIIINSMGESGYRAEPGRVIGNDYDIPYATSVVIVRNNQDKKR